MFNITINAFYISYLCKKYQKECYTSKDIYYYQNISNFYFLKYGEFITYLRISIFKIPKSKSGMTEHKNGEKTYEDLLFFLS